MVSADELGENVDWIAGIAERKIQDAIEEGLFRPPAGGGAAAGLDDEPL